MLRMQDPTNIPVRRIAAFLVDTMLMTAATVGLFFALGPTEQPVTASPSICDRAAGSALHFCGTVQDTRYLLQDGKAVQYLVGAALLWLVYAGVVQGLAGMTVGKALLGIRVVTGDGVRAGVGRMIVRSLPFVLGVLTMGFGFVLACIVGLVMIFAHPRHQRVGDLWARTFVVPASAVGRPPVATVGAEQDPYVRTDAPNP